MYLLIARHKLKEKIIPMSAEMIGISGSRLLKENRSNNPKKLRFELIY